VRHGLAEDERRDGQQEADVHAEVPDERLVHATRQHATFVCRPDDERQERFVEEAVQELRRSVGEAEAGHYSRAGRLDYSWQGLARYWRKKGL